jgi:hypothetical protein
LGSLKLKNHQKGIKENGKLFLCKFSQQRDRLYSVILGLRLYGRNGVPERDTEGTVHIVRQSHRTAERKNQKTRPEGGRNSCEMGKRKKSGNVQKRDFTVGIYRQGRILTPFSAVKCKITARKEVEYNQ